MKKLKFVLSLITQDNDYQIEQAASAEEIARRLGLDLKIVFADNDAIQQSQPILEFIQSKSAAPPDGIILEPAGGTALPQAELAPRRLPASAGSFSAATPTTSRSCVS